MTILELLESERSDLVRLRRLRMLHASDAETLRLIAELSDEKSERLVSLNELLNYREPKGEMNTNGNGKEGA